MSTKCGIPWIELQGTEQDWIDLRARATKICSLMVSEFGTQWNDALAPILTQFIEAYRGNVDHMFWQSMVKRIKGYGSGASDSISGWINVFYPYLTEGSNTYSMKQWKDIDQMKGPDPYDFPRIISSAPVVWDYNGLSVNLHFHAGMMGTIQDPETLALRPRIGWAVTHDPPMEPQKRIKQLEMEIADIKAGGDMDVTTQRWLHIAKGELDALKNGKPIPKKGRYDFY